MELVVVGMEQQQLVVVDGRLFFVADDGRHGRELWASDGTPAGTGLVAGDDLLTAVLISLFSAGVKMPVPIRWPARRRPGTGTYLTTRTKVLADSGACAPSTLNLPLTVILTPSPAGRLANAALLKVATIVRPSSAWNSTHRA